MTDYEALNLSPFANAQPEDLETSFTVRLGRRSLWRLPFELSLIRLTPGAVSSTVPVGRSARRVIFAHATLSTGLLRGGPIAERAGDYVVRFASGAEVVLPLRERFEIGMLGDDDVEHWGQAPFLAVSDTKDRRRPRWEGPYRRAGYRMTETDGGEAAGLFSLWGWSNPRPDDEIVTIEARPGTVPFVLAGITLGFLDEDPLDLPPARLLLIDADGAPDPLEVDVDRGVAGHTFVLPAAPAWSFLNGETPGFGEPKNLANSPAYVRITAAPSATVTVRSGAAVLGEARWSKIETGAASSDRLRLVTPVEAKNWVRTTVRDAATGDLLPCRIHFRSPAGVPYPPHGHHAHVNAELDSWHVDVGGDLRFGQATYAYIDGRCEGWLPRGDILIDVACGFEYAPLRTRIRIEDGQQELSLRLTRTSDVTAGGWYSGDTHVHFLSPAGAHLEARGEGLHVVNLLAAQWGTLFTNAEDLTGRPDVAPDGRSVVYVSQENRQHMLGHLGLLGLRTHVMPWSSDGLSEAEHGGTLDVTLSHWADAAHEAGGLVVMSHFPNPNGERAAMIATGRGDAVEIISDTDLTVLEYYRYLNAGYRLPFVGGTDKMSNDVAVGLYRTYARVDPDRGFSYDSWLDAIRAGRTIASGGALLSLRVDGHEIGDTLHLAPGGGTVEVEATATSVLPLGTLEIVAGGRVVARTDSTDGRSATLHERLLVDGDTWIVARCSGPRYPMLPDEMPRRVFAHTSPVYVACGEGWAPRDADTDRYMRALIEGSLAYVRRRARHASSPAILHRHGPDDHTAYLERPFLEALAALDAR